MSSSSANLSDRIFMTVINNNNTAYIGELEGIQKRLVEFTNSELVSLTQMLIQLNTDILYDQPPLLTVTKEVAYRKFKSAVKGGTITLDSELVTVVRFCGNVEYVILKEDNDGDTEIRHMTKFEFLQDFSWKVID